jgi:carboxyl-terminal processing protease
MTFRRLLPIAVTAFILLLPFRGEAQSGEFKIGKSLEVQAGVLREISALYVDSVNIDTLVYDATRYILNSLDPYTEFIPSEDAESLELLTTGSYGGIGATIRKDSASVLITEVYENTPAHKAGFVAGDRILEIDGESVADLPVEECSERMKGTPGSEVAFTIMELRGGDTLDVSVVREKVHFPDVVYHGMTDDTTGYIRIGGFTVNGARDVRKALVELREREDLKRVVIDLRGNGGGLLDEAVEIVSLFVPKNTLVVSSKGRSGETDIEYFTKSEPVDTELPLLVLVNSSSASSSEIVAGALQDMDRAVIAGTRTFGKGLVQSIRDVGYNNRIKITTAKYYTPSGRCVQAIDYSKRNSDGSVGYIPDSLKRPFKTLLKGRTVYDGGGIEPDVKIEPQNYSRLAMELTYSEILHQYSIMYFKENQTIASPSVFSLSDGEYEEFAEWASGKDFDHRTATEVEFDKLKKIALRESLHEGIEKELQALESKIKLGKKEVLMAASPEIRSLLEEEIVSKYYFRRGRVESILRNDSQLNKALELNFTEF